MIIIIIIIIIAVSIIWLWSSCVFLVQAFIFLFTAEAEAMERLLIKRIFGEECPWEADIEKIKAWVDCDNNGIIEESLMQLSEKIYYLQAESLWWSNGYTFPVLDDIPGFYEEVASLPCCSVRGQFWWKNVCVGVLLTLLLFHQQAQPCQIWQLVCTSDKRQIHYTVAMRSSSLFDRNPDTTSKQLLISEENITE